MKLKAVSGMLILLLIGMLTLVFNIQPAKSEPRTWTVYDNGPANFNTIQEAYVDSPVSTNPEITQQWPEPIKITNDTTDDWHPSLIVFKDRLYLAWVSCRDINENIYYKSFNGTIDRII